MPNQPHPGGRPSKYSQAYCNEVISCLAEGKSVTAFAGRIGVARSTVFKWADEIPEFSDALKVGQAKATEFWEDVLIKVAKEGGGNATAAIFGLKNRASDDWRDKQEIEHTHHHLADMSDDELVRIASGSGDRTAAKTNGSALPH